MRAAAPASLLVLALLPASAGAVGAEEWQLAAPLGFATVSIDGRRAAGALVGVEGQYGVNDAWAVRVALDSSWHPVDAEGGLPGGRVRASAAGAGITYAIDILRVVPFADLSVRLVDVGGAVVARRRGLGAEVGLGAEYLLSRAWAVAGLLRYEYFPVRLGAGKNPLGGDPMRFVAGLRLGRMF